MERRGTADLTLALTWEKDQVRHREEWFCPGFNFWRDLFPGSLLFDLISPEVADQSSHALRPGKGLPLREEKKLVSLPWSRLRGSAPPLYPGRFYPQGILQGVPDVFKETLRPFRCLETQPGGFSADLNPPLAGLSATLDIEIYPHPPKEDTSERGGRITDWMALLMDGPGIQARYCNRPTRFFIPKAFQRADETPDETFYATDRMVHHLDESARNRLAAQYGKLLQPGDKLLDLMAGWESHLPQPLPLSEVHGLGMNANEMDANPRITHPRTADLNQDPTLPYADHEFDAVVCSLSVEYLVEPEAVFAEAARVLKPGGVLAVAVSNRWFPEKAIGLWTDLHEFERMGLILEYFRAGDHFQDFTTLSQRGYPRPQDDPYFPGIPWSDPLYLVTGKTKE